MIDSKNVLGFIECLFMLFCSINLRGKVFMFIIKLKVLNKKFVMFYFFIIDEVFIIVFLLLRLE